MTWPETAMHFADISSRATCTDCMPHPMQKNVTAKVIMQSIFNEIAIFS